MENQQENKNEIDLSQLSSKIKGYFGRVNDSFFDTILFLKRNIIIVAVLVVVGITLGYFKDKASHSYTQQVYTIPNFGSTDYVYTEIERLNSKIKAGDTVFFNQIGIKNAANISKIEIEPVADLYNFVENPSINENENTRYEVLKLVSEIGDGKKLIEDPVTGKNFKLHLVTIRTSKKTTKAELIDPFVKHLNSNPYYKELQQPYVDNLKKTIVANDSTLKQIDGILNEYAKGRQSSANIVFAGEAGISDVIKLKNKLLKEQEQNRVTLINYTDIVKNASAVTNTSIVNITSNKMKVLYPVLLLLIFAAVTKFIKSYKAQVAKRGQK